MQRKSLQSFKTQTLSVCESKIIIPEQVNPTTLSLIGCPKVGLEPRGGGWVWGVGGCLVCHASKLGYEL